MLVLLLLAAPMTRRTAAIERKLKRLQRQVERLQSLLETSLVENEDDAENEEEDWGRPKPEEFPADAEDQRDILQEDARDSAESEGQDAEIQQAAYQQEAELMATALATQDQDA